MFFKKLIRLILRLILRLRRRKTCYSIKHLYLFPLFVVEQTEPYLAMRYIRDEVLYSPYVNGNTCFHPLKPRKEYILLAESKPPFCGLSEQKHKELLQHINEGDIIAQAPYEIDFTEREIFSQSISADRIRQLEAAANKLRR